MKPEKARCLDISSDLSGVSLLHAQEAIQKELSHDYVKELYWELRVASQGMGVAIKMAYLLGLDVNVDFEYDVDEWSLTGRRYGGDAQELTIWSPGA